MADALRKLYGSKRSKKMMGYDGPQWEQHTVAKLDSAMNDFVDSIPPHRTSQYFEIYFGATIRSSSSMGS